MPKVPDVALLRKKKPTKGPLVGDKDFSSTLRSQEAASLRYVRRFSPVLFSWSAAIDKAAQCKRPPCSTPPCAVQHSNEIDLPLTGYTWACRLSQR